MDAKIIEFDKRWLAAIMIDDNGVNNLYVVNNIDLPRHYILNENGDYKFVETMNPNDFGEAIDIIK